MSATETRNLRVVLIPWVITLVALLGLNALTPTQFRPRKGGPKEGIALTQPADEAQPPARVVDSLPMNLQVAAEGKWMIGVPSIRLAVEKVSRRWVRSAQPGSRHGRAPPVEEAVV